MRRLDVYRAILEAGVVPLYHVGDPVVAREIAFACARGGAPAVEFTDRGPMALEVFRNLASQDAASTGDLIVGAGSIPDAPTAALFLAAGAQFIVSPAFDPEIARLCNQRKAAYVPGCATVTEIARAEESGAEIVKVFPAAQLGGPDFIRSILAPRPWSTLMPTGGVTADAASLRAWFEAGAACVGLGSDLVGRSVFIDRDFDGLEAHVREVRRVILEVREEQHASA